MTYRRRLFAVLYWMYLFVALQYAKFSLKSPLAHIVTHSQSVFRPFGALLVRYPETQVMPDVALLSRRICLEPHNLPLCHSALSQRNKEL
jgi:hypothetical protein